MPRRKIRAHYEHISEFETGRAIGLKEAGWSNRLIARHLCRSDAAFRRCWQKWVNNGSMQRQDGSGRPRETTEREDRAIVRMAVAAPESTLSTIQRVTGTQVSKKTINRRLRVRNLRACLPLTPVHRQVRLQWCRERSPWNCADWGRIVFSDESRFLLCPDDRPKRVWRRPGQRVDPGLTVEHHTGWIKGERHMSFAVPMIWREPADHTSDCYFCLTKTTGITSKSRHTVEYPDLPSAMRPVPHSDILPVPQPPENVIFSEDDSDRREQQSDDTNFEPAMAAALQKIDLDPEQQLYTPKIVDIAAAVMEMHGDI
ncbi:hypothetical protein LAZ67_21001434 [Cordylochernes scorpioides]|uniref:Transposase Tc1-like domain-containing protein n=1 Tax=Cordylochernes scorpioides TaxID=51811 RepID=A0ABY6LM08_9ARAC|nr:hypothetical protein LAZ67_21001434 [Cordylochernes scorpioides]